MKNILLVCNYFAPENEVASIRLSKFAKYLKRYGYKVSVLAEKKTLNMKDNILQKDVEGIPVKRVENSALMKKIDALYSGITKNYREKKFADVSSRMKYNRKAGRIIFYPFEKMHPILGTFDYLLKMIKQFDLFCSAKAYLIGQKDVDVCFSSYGGYFGHFAGSFMKKRNPGIRWIADFRDPVYRFNFDPVLFAPAAVFYEWWSCFKCDDIIVVTKGMARKLPSFARKKVHCITNGYDLEDRRYFSRTAAENRKFVISYTGRMYGGMQDVSVVFRAVRELAGEDRINLENIEFRYAGTGFRIFASQAAKYGLELNCVDCGNVSRKQSLSIQADSDMLLIAVWDYKCQTIGAISGKALEYMMQRKPIIAVINGDVPRNELACMIRKAKLGAAYEQSHHERDLPALKDYIRLQYEQYLKHGKCIWEADEQIMAGYEYRYLVKKLMKVIESGDR